jgi:hypothetical protein
MVARSDLAISDSPTARQPDWMRWCADELLECPYVFLAVPVVVFGWAWAEPAFSYSHAQQCAISAVTTAILGTVLVIQILLTRPYQRISV